MILNTEKQWEREKFFFSLVESEDNLIDINFFYEIKTL